MSELAKSVYIFGSGSLAKCVADVLLADKLPQQLAFVDNVKDTNRAKTDINVSILEEDAFLKNRSIDRINISVAVGDNWKRQQISQRIMSQLYDICFLKIIHSGANVSQFARISEGAIILAGAVVNPSSSIGCHSVLWSNSVVEHDCIIGNCVTLCPGAVLGGNVSVGERSFIGVGASVRHNVFIGNDVVVAAGATVTRDLEDAGIYKGTPARLLRKRSPGDEYL